MAYLSLYRKYRPQFFADVVGQDHVVQTLQNALRSGHIANGYLFCGTRGVAKTTMARILAKGLNCIGTDGSATKPQPEPCNVCSPCRAIAAGQAVDVVELDAASNRSVNDIAKLRDSVQFGPMENRFKVYIVDEAHQLSSDAKDAFLKTLEEPPANVVFILATTETHAIPITIASRCQRFDFKRGSIGQLSKQVSRVLGHESVTMDKDAVVLIARAADGSYRDALSLLDQVLAYKRNDLTSDDVSEVLGSVKNDLLATTIQRIAESDFPGVFTISEELFNQGKDVKQFLKSLASRFRDMLFLSSGAKSSDDDQTFDDPILRHQASQFSPKAMMDALVVITNAEKETRGSNQHRLLLEIALLTLTELPSVPAAVTLPSTQSAANVDSTSIPTAAVATGEPDEVEDEDEASVDLVLEEVELLESHRDSPEPAEDVDRLTIPMFGLDNEPAPLPPITVAVPVSKIQVAEVEAEERELIGENDIPLVSETSATGHMETPDELRYLLDHWAEAVNHMRVISQGGVPYVKDATPISQVGQVITLEFTQASYVARLENPRAMERLQEVVNKVLKKPAQTFKVKAVLHGAAAPVKSAAELKAASAKAPPTVPADDAPSELLDEVISVFGGRIIEDDGSGR